MGKLLSAPLQTGSSPYHAAPTSPKKNWDYPPSAGDWVCPRRDVHGAGTLQNDAV